MKCLPSKRGIPENAATIKPGRSETKDNFKGSLIDTNQLQGHYNETHCWQYDIRIKNLEEDLRAANLTREEMNSLRVSDFQFQFVPKEDRPTCGEIARFVERHEWLRKMPRRPTHRFTATFKGQLAGVIVMATPNSFSNLLGAENRHLEKLISRGACISWSPKNLGSALLMFSIRWMAKHTTFRLFTAYSDVEARELGTIYQACNFVYLGQNSGAREEYSDPARPENGWFSDRQFRKTSQIRRYAKELGIGWQPSWSERDKIKWDQLPTEIAHLLKAQQASHRERCKLRALHAKHKYSYILGRTNSETMRLRRAFQERNPDLCGLLYPKSRGPGGQIAAADLADTAARDLTKNSRNCRPLGRAETEKPFLTVKEVACMLRVSDWTIYGLIKSDRTFPYLNIGLKKKLVIDRGLIPFIGLLAAS